MQEGWMVPADRQASAGRYLQMQAARCIQAGAGKTSRCRQAGRCIQASVYRQMQARQADADRQVPMQACAGSGAGRYLQIRTGGLVRAYLTQHLDLRPGIGSVHQPTLLSRCLRSCPRLRPTPIQWYRSSPNL